MRTTLTLLAMCAALAAPAPAVSAEFRDSTPEQRSADAQAFAEVDQVLRLRFTDVQSVVVALRGRVVYEFYRDADPDRLRDVQSVEKSALSALVGIALQEGYLRSLDQPVLSVMQEWEGLNADPRVRGITVRHLLTMSAGFDQHDTAGTARKLPPAQAWSRPLATTPGAGFAYDNSLIPMLAAVLERASGMRLPDLVRRHLLPRLQLAEPGYGPTLQLRTLDMAKLGQLFLRQGAWDGQQLMSAEYVAEASRPQNGGGPPVGMPYGFMWWIVPGEAPRRTFMASGYAGQLVWVYPPSDLVVAVTSTVSPDSQRRGQAIQLVRSDIFRAAQARLAGGAAN